ncbi:hypothetical protein KKG41_06845 [Patescibacteria group bacterium]|nr:hypothetical protein [Patescibacteria group bacterium]MBU1890992.1 hypothetical protein [Patescibacteria group bacterium]
MPEREQPPYGGGEPEGHGEDKKDHLPQYPTIEEQERDIDPEVLPVFEQLNCLARELLDYPQDEVPPDKESELSTLWDQFVDLLAEQGKRVHPQTLLALELPMSGLQKRDEVLFLKRWMLHLLPDNSEALSMYGFELERQHKDRLAEELYQQSVESLTRAIESRSDTPLHQILSDPVELTKLSGGERPVALLDLGDRFRDLARCQLAQGKYQETVESSTSATKLFGAGNLPKAGAWEYLGEAQARLGDKASARRNLDHALRIHRSKDAYAFTQLDRLLYAKALRSEIDTEEGRADEFFEKKDKLRELLNEAYEKLPEPCHVILDTYAELGLYDETTLPSSEPLNRPLDDDEARMLHEDIRSITRDFRSGYWDRVTKSESGRKHLELLRNALGYVKHGIQNASKASIADYYYTVLGHLEALLEEWEDKKAYIDEVVGKICDINASSKR